MNKKIPSSANSSSQAIHAMTVDVEDYFHVAALAEAIPTTDWDKWPLRVERNTQRLLTLFADKNIKATFFVLGWVANKVPHLIKEIAQAGHEIASHGYSHQLVFNQSQDVFREETHKSKVLLEDICQTPIQGYRAASYSITQKSLWALDILGELGFTWDSSIFPVHHDRYGIPNSPKRPYLIQTRHGHNIKELPLTTADVFNLSVPAAGGGYFRQYPYPLSKWLFNKASENGKKPQIFYLHPWEIDPEQPKVEGLKWFSRFRHYTNLDKCMPRLEKMIDDFPFGRVSDSLNSVEIQESIHINDLA